MSTLPDNASPFARSLYHAFYRPVDFVASAVEGALLILCSAAIAIAMALTAVDVLLRYGFSRPLGWSFDFVMLYLMPAAYYMAFAYGMRTGAHLSVDFFAKHLPRGIVKVAYPALLVLASALMLYIGGLIVEEAAASFVAGDTLFGAVPWPTWPTGAIIGASFLALAVRLALVACRVSFFEE